MFGNLLNEKISEYIENIKVILNKLLYLSRVINNNELIEIFENYIKNNKYAFLLTVAGEVNAGKSSLINVILGENILDVDVTPTTDKIYYIYYNEVKKVEIVSTDFVKVGLNHTVLNNITIVDTPGTNSIIKNHQKITEKFIPISDIVFIVFSVDNVYTNSSWEFLKYVADNWKRQVVIIINKIDKVKEEELKTHIKEVQKLSNKAGLDSKIFAVSTKLYLKNRVKESGFEELKKFIKENLENKKKLKLKYSSMLNFSKKVYKIIKSDYTLLLNEFKIHNDQRLEIDNIINSLENELQIKINELEKNIENYTLSERKILINDLEELFTHNQIISKGMSGIFNRNKKLKNSSKKVITKFEEKIKNHIKKEIVSFFEYFSNYYFYNLKKLDKIINKISFEKNFKAIDLSIDYEQFDKNRMIEYFQNFKTNFEKMEAIDYLSIDERIENFSTMLFGGSALTILSLTMLMIVHGLVLFGSGLVFAVVGIIMASKGIKINSKKIIGKIDRQVYIFIEKTNNSIEKSLKKEFQNNIEILKSGLKDFFYIVDKEKEKVNILKSNILEIENLFKNLI